MLHLPSKFNASHYNRSTMTALAVADPTVVSAFIAYMRAVNIVRSYDEGAGYSDDRHYLIDVGARSATKLLFDSAIDRVIWESPVVAYSSRIHRNDVIFDVFRALHDKLDSAINAW